MLRLLTQLTQKCGGMIICRMGIARLSASLFVGWAYDEIGPCALWASAFIFWCFQFVPFLAVWNHWEPSAMEKMHAQFDGELAADADAEHYSPSELAKLKGKTSTAGLKSPLLSGLE
jgi:hypothetical protein